MKSLKVSTKELHIPSDVQKYYPETQAHNGFYYALPREIKTFLKKMRSGEI